MMFNMLERIDAYLNENKIIFDEIKINGSILDDYFRISITNIIRRQAYKNHDKTLYLDDADYYLKRDDFGNLYMEAISHDKKYRVIMCSSLEKGINVSTDDRTSLFSQKAIMQDAAVYKILKNVRRRIKHEIEIDGRFNDLTPLAKKKIEINRMGVSLKHMFENNSGQMLTIYDQSEYSLDNQLTVEKIKNYISNYDAIGEICTEREMTHTYRK